VANFGQTFSFGGTIRFSRFGFGKQLRSSYLKTSGNTQKNQNGIKILFRGVFFLDYFQPDAAFCASTS
jgi:hypothetical protein